MRLGVAAAGFHVSPLAPGCLSWLPSGDHLIDSVAALYGPRSIGIVQCGMMRAGIDGLRTVKAYGGFAIAQDRTNSECFEMPSAAIDFAKAEIVMPPQRMASELEIIAQWWQGGSPSSYEKSPLLG
jgi:chemotaxis response regulator CheB